MMNTNTHIDTKSIYRADLHIHSRFSRATSGRLNVGHLAAWAGVKGIDVLGTGDITHAQWRQELREHLVFDDASGLYRMRKGLTAAAVAREVPGLEGVALKEPLFLLQGEVSSIYKKDGAVRKVHSILYMPNFEAADRLSARLERIGNLHSDGRPILGLDVHHLLEMVLETDPQAFLVPAHVWTPWFSLFGSKSGFDSLEACFGDLTPHIFALETGLSSDPDMNRCWSELDHLALISNSDAHSGENLGREVNIFSGECSYEALFAALRGQSERATFEGSVEFFPEEGKYHLDGHRACKVVLEPAECQALNNICPVCGKPLTVGVLHRVLALADRKSPPQPGQGFSSLIPLTEILGELLGCGPKTKKPQAKFIELIQRFGSELGLLVESDLADVGRYWPELGEALRRMRANEVIRQGGYDGEYGVIRLFSPSGKSGKSAKVDWNSGSLLPEPASPKSKGKALKAGQGDLALTEVKNFEAKPAVSARPKKDTGILPASPSQQIALSSGPGPVLVLAGPGAGKTRTLVGRILHLTQQGVPSSAILAVTFTRRAAGELRERLTKLGQADIWADTLHALALRHWPGTPPYLLSEESSKQAFALAQGEALAGVTDQAQKKILLAEWEQLALLRECQAPLPENLAQRAANYTAWKQARHLADYTDLLERWLDLLQSQGPLNQEEQVQQVLVDEVQDLSPLQWSVLHALLPADGQGLFGIGDPDQAIYSFRGAIPDVTSHLQGFWPHLSIHGLTESYRASDGILQAAAAVLPQGATSPLRSVTGRPATLQWLHAPSARHEAEWIATRIAHLLGGSSHHEADRTAQASQVGHLLSGSCSPGDIAILVRLKALMPCIKNALDAVGIPCAVPEADAFWLDERIASLLQQAEFSLNPALAPQLPSGTSLPVPAHVWKAGPQAVLDFVQPDPLFYASRPWRQLLAAYAQHQGWEGLLDFIRLRRDIDLVRNKAEYVQLMTLHAAKGLEFKAVFLPCLEQGIVPFAGIPLLLGQPNPTNFHVNPAEEARLLYVGLTRGAEAVYASAARQRSLYGHTLTLKPTTLLPYPLFHPITLTPHTQKRSTQLLLE